MNCDVIEAERILRCELRRHSLGKTVDHDGIRWARAVLVQHQVIERAMRAQKDDEGTRFFGAR